MHDSALEKPDGIKVTPKQYIELHKKRPGRVLLTTFCPECHQETRIRVSKLRKIGDHFAHLPNANPIQCKRRDDRDDWYFSARAKKGEGDAIRKAIRDEVQRHYLWTATNAMLHDQDARLITPERFVELADDVNRLGRWDRSGMEVGIVPQIILAHGLFCTGNDGSVR